MKKKIVLILSIFVLIITFIFAEISSIYHFGDVPTFLTLLYLISIFSIFESILVVVIYFVKKIIKKVK